MDQLARLTTAIVQAAAILIPPLNGAKLRPIHVTNFVALVIYHGLLITLRPLQLAPILRSKLLALQ